MVFLSSERPRWGGERHSVMVLLQAGEQDGGKAPADASASGTPAERHATARRGLRRRVTGSEGLAAVGVAVCGAEGSTSGGAACKGRTDGKTVGPGGGCSRTHWTTSETVEVSRRPVGVRYWRQGGMPIRCKAGAGGEVAGLGLEEDGRDRQHQPRCKGRGRGRRSSGRGGRGRRRRVMDGRP